MRPFQPFLLLILAVCLSSLSVAIPWAEATYIIGDSGERVSLPINFTDTTRMLQGCPRGSALGDDASLDRWIWTGRAFFVVQVGLWIGFLTEYVRRRRWTETGLLSAGLLILLILLLSKPTIECLYVQFPPPLSIEKPWRPGMAAFSLSLTGLITALFANIAVRRAAKLRRF